MKVTIVGGGVAGKTCAALLRRLPAVESIVLLEGAPCPFQALHPSETVKTFSSASPVASLYTGLWSPSLKILSQLGTYYHRESDPVTGSGKNRNLLNPFGDKICFVGKSGYKSVDGDWIAQPSPGILDHRFSGDLLAHSVRALCI